MSKLIKIYNEKRRLPNIKRKIDCLNDLIETITRNYPEEDVEGYRLILSNLVGRYYSLGGKYAS